MYFHTSSLTRVCGKGRKGPGSGVWFRRLMESCCSEEERCLCCPAVTIGWWLWPALPGSEFSGLGFTLSAFQPPLKDSGSPFGLGFSTPWALVPACGVKLPLGDFAVILILRESLLVRVGWYHCQIPQNLKNSQNRRHRIVICTEPHSLPPHHTLFQQRLPAPTLVPCVWA